MNNPKPEHRLTFLEKQYLNLGGHFEQLEDEIRNDITQLGTRMDKSFDQAHAYIDHHMSTLDTRLSKIETDISELKSMMKQLLEQKS